MTTPAWFKEQGRLERISERSDLQAQRRHEQTLARIANRQSNRTPGANFLKGLKARIKAGGPQGSQADRAQLSFNPPPFKKKKRRKYGGYG